MILSVAPRLIAAGIYKHLNETMDFLWDKDLAMNTVHVRDVCSALWHLINRGTIGEVYNLADENATSTLSSLHVLSLSI